MKAAERFSKKIQCPRPGADLIWIFSFLIFSFLVERLGGTRVPSIVSRNLFGEPSKKIPGPEKHYTGIKVREDSILLVYYHEQTVAVVEVDQNRQLFNCELLEVRTKTDKQVSLDLLKSVVPWQRRIAFSDMMSLMNECQKLDPPNALDRKFVNEKEKPRIQINPRQLASIFSGVFPGTKWCGAGDIAGSYHDLGAHKQLDKCCRTHDLCPVKVAGLKTQYNITNYSVYTRSHCDCDSAFHNCLKTVGTSVSNFLGNIYFNVAQVICVEDVPPHEATTKTKRLVSKSMRF